jgi:RNA polymerase sigma-70 factor (ECF subfamily)
MDDKTIIELYFARSEEAIEATDRKYGGYCRSVAYRILHSEGDSEECVNDTYLRAWSAIPPTRPNKLSAFLGRITRNLAIDRFSHSRAEKRYSEGVAVLDELAEVIADPSGAELADELTLRDALSDFVRELKPIERRLFLGRYWYVCSVRELAEDNALSESNVKVTLMRLRDRLRGYLLRLGISL